jgi:D-lactate dehydrogenase
MIINTSRGGLIDSTCLIEGLKNGKIGYLGLDVYEEEEGVFFEDHSGRGIQDDILARLLTFPNVMITGHQAFFTENALRNISTTTLKNIADFKKGAVIPENEVALTQ